MKQNCKKTFRNRLNDLDGKTWLKFQKSWFVHSPPPRKKGVLRHPAKFPETLASNFVEFFTKAGQTVLDPMAGTGSTIVACLRSGRNGIGIEINKQYATIAREVVCAERASLGESAAHLKARIVELDARQISSIALPPVDYVFTSPPYWDMLHARGSKTQRVRRENAELDVFYSNDSRDLGNLSDYDEFLDQLCCIYESIQPLIRDKAYMTIIVKNIKKGGTIYPLAWDIAKRLGKTYALKDERIWCQDNIPLAPYGMGSAWVSNTFHHYCLQFRKE